jgi:hypothetical protein
VTPSVAIILAYRDSGDSHRRAAYGYVIDHVWNAYSEVRLCDSGQQPFSRGGSFNQGAERSQADVLVFADADVVPEPAALAKAVNHAYVLGVTAYPYREYVRLAQHASAAIQAGAMRDMVDLANDPEYVEWKELNSVGGIFVCRRSAYLACGGCDPRFVGWGFEDVAWSATSATLLGDHVREAGSLLHLWHPWDPHSGPASKAQAEREIYDANVALCERYTSAVGDAEAIRAVRAEAGLVAA